MTGRLLITGSRDWTDDETIRRALAMRYQPDIVRSSATSRPARPGVPHWPRRPGYPPNDGSSHERTATVVARYRVDGVPGSGRELLMAPIRPGTARRLGLYQPDPPPPAPFTPEWADALGAAMRDLRESVRHIRRINAEKRP